MKRFESLYDVMEYTSAPDFEDILNEYFTYAPRSRENTEEILDTIDSYDIYELYIEIFDNREHLLTPEEMADLKHRYRKTFDIPLREDFDF